MDLTPKLPPGRANRKALGFGAEIIRLRVAGYSFEAIRLALYEAGVRVSLTTVKREAAKYPTVSSAARRQDPTPSSSSQSPPPSPAHPPRQLPVESAAIATSGSYVGDSRSGKAIVDEFMRGRVTNPLLQERDAP